MNQKHMRNILSILLIFFSIDAYSQLTNELLDKRVGEDSCIYYVEFHKAGISATDITLLCSYERKMRENNPRFDTLTYRNLFDTLAHIKRRMYHEIAETMNFGKDSVFLRTPLGEKFFVGMGILSIDKFILRESLSLPERYDEPKFNLSIVDVCWEEPDFIEFLMNLDDMTRMLFGNIVLSIAEWTEETRDYKIGDILEIAVRLKNSKEFKPIFEKNLVPMSIEPY